MSADKIDLISRPLLWRRHRQGCQVACLVFGETTTTAIWLDTIATKQLGANMRNHNSSPASWVGWFALLCAFLALITPAGKQAVQNELC
jgi:hypothetical protein